MNMLGMKVNRENVFARYYQQSTYNHDFNQSPRGQPSYGDFSPRGGQHHDSQQRGDPRYFREAPREYIDNRYGEASHRPPPVQPGEQFFVQEPRHSPRHSPISPRRQPPHSDRSDRRGYDGVSPPPMVASNSPRRYPFYDMSRDDLPPMNTYAINSTTQHDYGDFNTRTTQKEYGDFAQKQLMINDIRARGDPELARRYEQKYDSRPYFDDKDPPSFYRNLPLTDRSGYDPDRRAPRLDDGPLTDRSEQSRRAPPLGHSPLPPDHALNDMARGQMKKELDRIELHDGNFKPYSHHNLGGGEEDNDHVENGVYPPNSSDRAERPSQLYRPYHMQNIQQHHDNPRPTAHHQRLFEQSSKLDPFSPLSPGASSGSKKTPRSQEQQVISGPIAHHKRLYERPPSKTANCDKVKKVVAETQGPGVLSRPIGHHQHRYEDNLMQTTSPRRSQDPGVLSRQIENHEHRFESNLVETNNSRRSTDPGILPRQVEHSEHRFENDLVETNNPRRSQDPGVLPRQIENHEHRFESNLVETNYPRRDKIMHPKEDDMEPEGPFFPDVLLRPEERMVKQKLPMHDYHRFEQVHKTDNPERLYPDHKQGQQNPAGVLLFIRSEQDGFKDVKRAFEKFTGDTPSRKILGIAMSDMIKVLEGGDGWQKQAVIARWNGQYHTQERHGSSVEKLLAVQWLPDERKAREWVDIDKSFQQPTFPWPYGNQTSILPLRYQPSSAKGYRTFMLIEFNNITDRQELRRYIDFMCKEMSRFRADIAFVDTKPVAVKSTIFHPSSHVVCHMFCDQQEAERCFREVIDGRNFKHADVTTIVFSLLDIMRKK